MSLSFLKGAAMLIQYKSMTTQLWRGCAMLLLVLLGLLHMAPLVTQEDAAASVRLCCRSHGKHACAELRQDGDSAPKISRVMGRCPFGPASTVSVHGDTFEPATAAMVFAEIAAHPACRAQTAARARIAFDRTRQKRGPPADALPG